MEKQRNYKKEFKVQVCELVLKENIKVNYSQVSRHKKVQFF